MIVLGFGLISLVSFIIFEEMEVFELILVFVFVVLIASLISYSVRKNLKWNLWEHEDEDPVSGSV